VQGTADAADKIHQDELRASPADLQAEGKRSFRIERERHRGLSDAAALGLLPEQQTVRLQLLHDDLNRRRGEPRLARNVGLGQGPVMTDQREDEPLVVEPNAGLIGAAAELERPRLVDIHDCGPGGGD
jgi:hypothetical protein